MTIVGFILLVVGLAVFGLVFTNNAPEVMREVLNSIGLPLWAWLAMAGVGAVLMYFNRRPAD